MALADSGHAAGSPVNCVLIRDRTLSFPGSEQYDEHGARLIKERTVPCRMRRIWRTLALLQFLTAAALLITDVYAHKPISHLNPLLVSENTTLIDFRWDLYLGIISAVFQFVAAFTGLLPLGIPFRVYPPARYRSAHFLLSVFTACLMVIAAVSYGVVITTISKDTKVSHNLNILTPAEREQNGRNVIFTFRILLSLLIILVIGAIVDICVVIAVCTAGRKCYRNCKTCSAEH